MVNTKIKQCVIILLCLGVWVALFSILRQTQFSALSQVSKQISRTSSSDDVNVSEDQHKAVLLIHYHKTGNQFIHGLIQNLNDTFQDNLHDIRVGENISPEKVNRSETSSLLSSSSSHGQQTVERRPVDWRKHGRRNHNKTTGCPILDSNSYAKDSVRTLTAPDFFCDLLQESQLPPPINTKIVHFVRDPINMALSNYLYHSQNPTPEPWVKRPNFNPCKHDPAFFQYVLEELTNVTVHEIDKVYNMCMDYRYEGTSRKNKPRAFYALLRDLPTFDGLRLATTQFIIAKNGESGADLLRMPNNIKRLQAWESGDRHPNQSILTVSMDQLIGDMKNTIMNITNFIFSHNQNDTARLEIAETISGNMVKAYKDKKERATKKPALSNFTQHIQRGNTTIVYGKQLRKTDWKGTHVMQGVMNKSERQNLKRRLEEDEVLGPILLKMRAIVNAVLEE
jgi:hypothetical protein